METFLGVSFVCATYGHPFTITHSRSQCYSYGTGDIQFSYLIEDPFFAFVSFVTRVWLWQSKINYSSG